MYSDCCDAIIRYHDICSDCGEHADVYDEPSNFDEEDEELEHLAEEIGECMIAEALHC